MRHWHTTPFEMCEIKLHVRVPMDCWRQWIRHRTANINEYSTRYSVAIDAAQTTAPGRLAPAVTGEPAGKRRNAGPSGRGRTVAEEQELQDRARAVYEHRLALGVAGAAARTSLLDIHGGVLEDRSSQPAALSPAAHGPACTAGDPPVRRSDRQRDREPLVPDAWEAFLDYRFEARNFSRIELAVIREIGAGNPEGAVAARLPCRTAPPDRDISKRNREREELEEKLTG